jgi:excisionase family DNA binding protein
MKAAEYVSQSPWTLREKAAQGKIASYKLGNRLMFDPDELDLYLSEHARPRLVK